MNNKKGQGAMEYLMTYGWAILVVLIVGIVLWQLGIFNMAGSSKGMNGFGQVKPSDWQVDCSSGNAEIAFVNGASVRVVDVSCKNVLSPTVPANPTVTDANRINISIGEIGKVRCTGGSRVPGNAYRLNVKVAYNNTVTGIYHIDEGVLYGPCAA